MSAQRRRFTLGLQHRPGHQWREVASLAGLCALDVVLFSRAVNDVTGLPAFPVPVVIGYAVAGFTVLHWRNRAPVLVFAVIGLHSVAAVAAVSGYRPTLGIWCALYAVASTRAWRPALICLACCVAPLALVVSDEVSSQPAGAGAAVATGTALLLGVLTAAVFAAGRMRYGGERRIAALERQRARAAAEAIAAERARIARELHDIVAASVTLMVLQAGGAGKVLAAEPARAAQALAHIEELGSQAMEELRRMLTVLRTPHTTPGTQAGAEPPGVGDIPDLVEEIRRTGHAVRLEIIGAPVPVDPSVGLAAYRTVQEALTNVTKHAAPGASAVVSLTWQEHLRLRITDTPPTHPPPEPSPRPSLSTGHGLLGLRERVQIAGGHLEAGPHADGGFQVTATLPLRKPR